MKQINSAWLLAVKVVRDKGGPNFLYISKGRKSETAMADKNKTYKYPVDMKCQNMSCLLLRLKSRLGKVRFQLPLNKTFFPTPDPSFIDDWSSAKEQKLTKQYFLPPPHRFSSQSSQYQNWKLNKYSILTVIDIEAPVSESSNRISKFYASTVLITNLMKPELKMATHRIQSGLD